MSNKHIASCSFGKDSLASILLAVEHDEPLDEAVYCEVMFDRSISGEIPEHADFIYNKAIPALKGYGINTVILRSDWTYMVTLCLLSQKDVEKASCVVSLSVGYALFAEIANFHQ